jgi:hypothetical protein
MLTVPIIAFVAAISSHDAWTIPSSSRLQRSRSTSFGWTLYEADFGLGLQSFEQHAHVVRDELLTDAYEHPGRIADVSWMRPASVTVCKWGVPERCFIGWRAQDFGGKSLTGGDLNALVPSGTTSRTRIVPFLPLYRGLAINLLWFSLLWFILLTVASFARRSLRRRRGLCPACAYDLRATPAGSPCPECGTPTSARPARLNVASASTAGRS